MYSQVEYRIIIKRKVKTRKYFFLRKKIGVLFCSDFAGLILGSSLRLNKNATKTKVFITSILWLK